jgi:alkanesulfonate monooxygenase SsuD/methylene tetrahydromethanopterin reductase-like flavin-dependent oxidoreductase (luciferase family)
MNAIVITPDNSISYQLFAQLAREAEDGGFSHVFIPEGTNDSLMCAYAVALATSRMRIATYTSNIYYRDPALCAASAEMVQDASEGRFALGLGIGHRQSQAALGIEMGNPRAKLRDFTVRLRGHFAGTVHPDFPVSFRKPSPAIPVYYASTTLETCRLAGELADGLELYMSPARRSMDCARAADAVAAAQGRPADAISVVVGLPIFLDEDIATAREQARTNLMYHLALPNYIRQLGKAGFEAEAAALTAAAERQDWATLKAAISDDILDACSLIGPASRCVEQLGRYREETGGRVLPIIFPFPFTGDYPGSIRSVIRRFGAR